MLTATPVENYTTALLQAVHRPVVLVFACPVKPTLGKKMQCIYYLDMHVALYGLTEANFILLNETEIEI